MARNHITVIDRCEHSGPEAHGLAALLGAIRSAGVDVNVVRAPVAETDGLSVMVGRGDRKQVRLLTQAHGVEMPAGVESTFLGLVGPTQRPILLVSGGGSAGLMYAALELAERVRHTGFTALTDPAPLCERAALAIRGVDRFISGHLDESWFHSDEFWHTFLDTLARDRLNRFVLITGFDTAYMSPPYPYFVDAPGFPTVTVRGLDAQARKANLERLRRIGTMCAERAIDFLFGIWQQIPWQDAQSRVVDGLPENEDDLALYCAAGLRELLMQCEQIRGIHLRVNHEAGVGTQTTAEGFWNTLTDAVASCGREIRLDLRAKGLTDGMIRHALAAGLEVSVPTKYWCEQTGLPHHLTQMRSQELSRLDNLNHGRRYSYSNLLRRPRAYDMIYRLWNLGATNLFLWGDPDYVRRYCASMQIGDAPGFEVASPLSLKWGHELRHQEPWPLFVDPTLMPARFEDERYWYHYLLFGRIGYSPSTRPEVFTREFSRRFGLHAGACVARAYASSGRVIPLITASHMPQHPMLVYWPELSTGGALFAEHNWNRGFGEVTYGSAEPSDPGLFSGIDEYAADLVSGTVRDRFTPLQVGAWFRSFASETRCALMEAREANDLVPGPEWAATELDLSILASLADYHASKIVAALQLALYERTGARAYVPGALEAMRTAADCWNAVVTLGTGTYHDPLDFQAGNGNGRAGHWKDAIPELQADVFRLESIARDATDRLSATSNPNPPADPTLLSVSPPPSAGDLTAPERVRPGEPVDVVLYGPHPGLSEPVLRYRRTDQTEGEFRRIPMEWRADRYVGTVPAGYVEPGLDLLVYATGIVSAHETAMAPGLYHPTRMLPYLLVRVDP